MQYIDSSVLKTSLLLNIIDQNMIILQTDIESNIVDISDGFCDISGYSKSELIGSKCTLLSSGLHTKEFYKDMWESIKDGQVWKGEIQDLNKNGSLYWLDMKIIPLTDEQEIIIGYLSLSNNITALKYSHEGLNNIITSTNDIIYTLNADGVFEFVSPSWTNLLGHELSEVQNHHFAPFVHPDDIDTCVAYLKAVLSNKTELNQSVQYRVFHKNGGIHYHQSRASILEKSSSSIKFLAIASDITQRVQQEKEIQEKNEKLERLATVDYLTGLYNRAKIDEFLQYAYHRFQRYNNPFGIIMLDIDYFKEINDEYGHQVGDIFLVELSEILSSHSRLSDFIGRWGGEEFLIVSANNDREGLETQAQYIRKSIEKFDFTHVGSKTVSIGISIVIKGDDADSLIKRADDALYDAKNSGRNRVCFR